MNEVNFNIEVKGSKAIIKPAGAGGYSTLAGLQKRYDSLCRKLVIDGIYIGNEQGEVVSQIDELKSEAELNKRFHDLGLIGRSSTSKSEKQQNMFSKEQKELIVVSLVIIFSSMFLITFGGYKLFEPIGLHVWLIEYFPNFSERFSSMAKYDGDPIIVRYEVSYTIGMVFSLIIGSYIGLFYCSVNTNSPLAQFSLSKQILFFIFFSIFFTALSTFFFYMIFLSDMTSSKKVNFMLYQNNFFSLSYLMALFSGLTVSVILFLRSYIYINCR